MMRAVVSAPPPGGNPTIRRTGHDGYACALADPDTIGSAAAPAARCRKCLRWGCFISDLPGMRATAGFPQSFRLDVDRPNHLGPLLRVVSDELAEIGGRAGNQRAAE